MKKDTSKTLTKSKVEALLAHNGAWNGKEVLTASDFAGYTEIAAAAFQDQNNLKRVEIPSTIKKIGHGAFINCLRLKEVSLPEGLESFGIAVFGGCWSLKKVNIPEDFVVIPDATFADCENLTSVKLCNNIKKIGLRAFANCISLKEIFIPSSTELVRENAFTNCPNLEKGYFNENLYFQAYKFGLFEEQFNVLNINLREKTSATFLYEQKDITKDEYQRIMNKVEYIKFKPRGVTPVVPALLVDDKPEDGKLVPMVKTKKENPNDIPVTQKHTIVTIPEYENYVFETRRDEWKAKAGHNEKQLVCSKCHDDDNWATILLEDGRHICYFCWMKKPEVKKASKALVVKKATPAKKPAVKKEAPKKVEPKKEVAPKKAAPKKKAPKAVEIPVNQKHTVVSVSEYKTYNYEKRRKEWHSKAGFNDKQVQCNICGENDNWASIKLENGKHICYTCWVSKPKTLESKYNKKLDASKAVKNSK